MRAMLKGKKALITGATSGIGQACARLFVKEGATVVATGRNEAALTARDLPAGSCVVFMEDDELIPIAECVADCRRAGRPGRDSAWV